MENTIAMTIMGVLATTIGLAQTTETKSVQEVITAFAMAGDNSDAEGIERYLDDNFRIVLNRLFGSNTVSVMPRSLYLEKIRSGEFGGDRRKVTVESVVINGTTASAKVTFEGTKMTFVSLLTLIQNEAGSWRLVSDVPIVR